MEVELYHDGPNTIVPYDVSNSPYPNVLGPTPDICASGLDVSGFGNTGNPAWNVQPPSVTLLDGDVITGFTLTAVLPNTGANVTGGLFYELYIGAQGGSKIIHGCCGSGAVVTDAVLLSGILTLRRRRQWKIPTNKEPEMLLKAVIFASALLTGTSACHTSFALTVNATVNNDQIGGLYSDQGSNGIVYVTPASEGLVVELLDRGFALVPINNLSANRKLPPPARGVVVHASDLIEADARLLDFLALADAEGRTVAVVDAGPLEASALVEIVGREYPVQLESDDVMPLVALREDRNGNVRNRRTHLLFPREEAPGTNEQIAITDTNEADWLEQAFLDLPADTATPPNGFLPRGSSPTDELTQLADSILTDSLKSDSYGDTVQCVNTTWTTRSFTQELDYYYVQQTLTNKNGDPPGILPTVFDVTETQNTITDTSSLPVIVQSAPGTTQNATQINSGVSFGIGGMAGYKVNPVFLVTPSMMISNSTSTTVDSTNVANQSDPSTGSTSWSYLTGCGNNCFLTSKTYCYIEHWIWAVPFSAYSTDQESLTFRSETTVSYDPSNVTFCFAFNSVIPLPFNQTMLGAPTVTSVSPTSAGPGEKITVTGTNFYQLEGVMIGGNVVPSTGYAVTESNTTMSVVIPANQPNGSNQSVIVSTQLGISNDDVTISIN